ncbi:hypothetical protein NM208_g7589 [Fusarium decemcellulare]|uniref:Uncharacterized protein n=1 Tax=Fusarium decemcellulare TaxID=57161 RepID=A0ACC1S8M4_9HYPO|nr:hypothetical protein NM208_g7589 [Fusarium decemcellulare]
MVALGTPLGSSRCYCKALTVVELCQEEGFVIADDLAAVKESAEREDAPCQFCQLCWTAFKQRYPRHFATWVKKAIASRKCADKYLELKSYNGWEYPIVVRGKFTFSIDQHSSNDNGPSQRAGQPRQRQPQPQRAPQETGSTIEISSKRSHLSPPILGAFALPGSKGADYIAERSSSINTDANQKAYLYLIQQWMHECSTNHQGCASITSRHIVMPARVMDVANGQNPRLVITNGESERYLALSYCWGSPGTDILKLTYQTMSSLCEGAIDESAFAKTHREAFHLARSLGVRYIWVDALCIIQDDRDDWSIQSVKMGDIYGNADLTIIAGSCPDVRHGFLQNRTNIIGPFPIPFDSHDRKPFVFATLLPSTDTGPTATRGWCFQEAMLSKRSVVFGVEQMSFWCPAGKTFEFKRRNDMTLLDLAKVPNQAIPTFRPEIQLRGKSVEQQQQAVLQHWYVMLREFSTCQFTNSYDVFASISSLAQMVARYLDPEQDRYLAGIWEVDMVRGLLWRARYQKQNSSVLRRPPLSESANRAPSWSWAAVCGPVDHIDFEQHSTIRDPTDGTSETTSIDGHWMTNSVFSTSPDFIRVRPAVEVVGSKQRRWSEDSQCGPRVLHMPACELRMAGFLTKAYVSDEKVKVSSWQPRQDWRPRPQRGRMNLFDGKRLRFEDALSVYAHGSWLKGAENADKCFGIVVFDVQEEACKNVWCLQMTEIEGLVLQRVKSPDGNIKDGKTFQRLGVFWLEDKNWFNVSVPSK